MNNRRRIYLVNKRFQGRFIAAFISVSVTGIIAAVTVMLYYIHAGFEENLYRSHFKVSNTGQILLPILVKVNLPFFILGIAVMGLISLYYFRKANSLVQGVMGGLYELKKGNLDFRLAIGQEREFPNLESSFNYMIASNKAKVLKLKVLSLEMDEVLKKGPSAMDELKLKAGEIKEVMDGVKVTRVAGVIRN